MGLGQCGLQSRGYCDFGGFVKRKKKSYKVKVSNLQCVEYSLAFPRQSLLGPEHPSGFAEGVSFLFKGHAPEHMDVVTVGWLAGFHVLVGVTVYKKSLRKLSP